jgi:hypothetical protein
MFHIVSTDQGATAAFTQLDSASRDLFVELGPGDSVAECGLRHSKQALQRALGLFQKLHMSTCGLCGFVGQGWTQYQNSLNRGGTYNDEARNVICPDDRRWHDYDFGGAPAADRHLLP